MHNIKYSDMARARMIGALKASITAQDELISQMSERLARDYDRRVIGLIEKRLGAPVVLTTLKGRLTRVITRDTGYETLLLDGRPFARVYEATVATNELKTTANQVIEELEG